MKYTKGDWEIKKNSTFIDVQVWDGIECKFTCSLFMFKDGKDNHHSEENQGNAKLISKAPEMYEALKDLVSNYNDINYDRTQLLMQIGELQLLLKEIES